jgi:hypothetical protein
MEKGKFGKTALVNLFISEHIGTKKAHVNNAIDQLAIYVGGVWQLRSTVTPSAAYVASGIAETTPTLETSTTSVLEGVTTASTSDTAAASRKRTAAAETADSVTASTGGAAAPTSVAVAATPPTSAEKSKRARVGDTDKAKREAVSAHCWRSNALNSIVIVI